MYVYKELQTTGVIGLWESVLSSYMCTYTYMYNAVHAHTHTPHTHTHT